MTDSLIDITPLAQFSRIVAITGAGISAAAGLGTFRGAGGLWTASPDVELAMQSSALPTSAAGPTPSTRRSSATAKTRSRPGRAPDQQDRVTHHAHARYG